MSLIRRGVVASLEALLGHTVLIVDDEPFVLDVVKAMLEEFGCAVVTATTPTEALAKLAGDERIEILITDINMPGMSGYDLAEKAKQTREGLEVIVLSDEETPVIRENLLQTMKRTTRRH
jgi:two-component system, cell cycle response regulator CpdR